MFHHTSRIFGAMLLIAGCCIGAGMLGLPLVSLAPGFLPTSVMFLISWLFMALTGLLVLEVSLRCGQGVNLMTMAEISLGKVARYAVAFLFAFLFYCLLVAYISGTGGLIEEFVTGTLHLPFSSGIGSTLAVLVFGFAIYVGTRNVDRLNRILMLGLGLAYLLLVFLGLPKIALNNLKTSQWAYAVPVLPAMIISFGYHNLIPSLNSYLNGDARGLRIAILGGSLIPLVVYLIWELVFLGIVPHSGATTESIKSGAMVTDLFRSAVTSPKVLFAMHFFAFFAIATSFLTVAMSFVDFTVDGLKMGKSARARLLACCLVLLPPFFFSFLFPRVFLTALNYAGAFGAVILFGILPVMMVWKQRKGAGKIVLVALAGFALFVFLMQLKIELNI